MVVHVLKFRHQVVCIHGSIKENECDKSTTSNQFKSTLQGYSYWNICCVIHLAPILHETAMLQHKASAWFTLSL